jgi:Protein affecting phage T7 exclusion by the F plasmid
MRFPLIPLVLLALPIAEISAFVVIGGRIGLAATLGLIVLSAAVGAVLLRWQGFGRLARIQAEMQAGRVPGRDLVHGAMIMIAALLLIVPGFVSDVLGILLFIPPVREAVCRFVRSRITVVSAETIFAGARRQGPDPRGGKVVDLDEGDFHRAEPGKSPWSTGGNDLPPPGKPGRDGEDGL